MAMKKYVIRDSFGFDNLVMVDEMTPEPCPGRVVVRMKAVALNFRDLMVVQGLYNPRQKLPLVPLSDGVGEVVAAGEGVTRAKVGDRVCTTFFQRWWKGDPTADELRSTLGSPADGALAEFMELDEQGLVHAPAHLTDEEAATLPCAGVTAWTALSTLGGVKAGDTVLTLGTGGVSIFALQFAGLLGARAIATSSSNEKIQRLSQMGAAHVINYKDDPNWGQTAKELSGGEGVDHVIEVGGAGTLEQSLQAVKIRGRVSLIGVLSGVDAKISLRAIFMRGIRVQGIFVGPRSSFEDMNRAIAMHHSRPVVDRVFPFEEAREAMRYMASGKHFGKVCIRVS